MAAPASAHASRNAPPASTASRALKGRLCGEILPFWLAKGWDARRGGFHERFFFDGTPDSLNVRRVRTQFRQINALALAAELGWREGLRPAFRGLEYMLERAWSPDGAPGFAHVLAPDGAPVEVRRDASDHASALEALSTLARVSEDAQVMGLLRLLMSYIENALHDAAGWIKPDDSATPPLRHVEAYIDLFSALLSAHEAVEAPQALERAARYRRQIETSLLDPDSGLLPMYLGLDNAPRRSGEAFLVSPGLMVRTTLAIRRFEGFSGLAATPLGTHLLGAALRASAPATGFLLEGIDSIGAVQDAHTRLPAQCALVEAWLIQARTGVEGAFEASQALIEGIEARFLQSPFRGGWIDRLDADGTPAIDTVPADSLHALVALAVAANPG